MSALPAGKRIAYERQRKALQERFGGSSNPGNNGGPHQTEMRYSPLVSLAVKLAVDDSDGESETESESAQQSSNSNSSTTTSGEAPSSDGSSATTSTDDSDDSSSNSSSIFNDSSAIDVFPQYGLLGFNADQADVSATLIEEYEPILQNTDTPSSAFICGSQGSGKSYTLACMLENCLVKRTKTAVLHTPLSGLVFHYDVDGGSTVAEAIALCSRGVKVNVLVSLSNYWGLASAYETAAGKYKDHVTVTPLLFKDSQMTTKQITRLMAFTETDGPVPLYMEVLQRIIRNMALENTPFSLARLEKLLNAQTLNPTQTSMLNIRMDLLRSFLVSGAKGLAKNKPNFPPISKDDKLATPPGTLTINDLSDSAVSASTACVLFEICLSLFKAVKHPGFVVALDEAHKFIDQSAQAADLTSSLTTTIREQRHNGARIIVATQEPTISADLLDLCSVSIVHRFTSPAWFNAIRDHLGAASSLTTNKEGQEKLFQDIIQLQQGESFVFSPSSYLYLEAGADGGDPKPHKLGHGILKMKTRLRQGQDAGKSKSASEQRVLPYR